MSRLSQAELSVMTRLHALSTPLTAMSDLTAILNEALEAIMELQGADFGNIRFYDDATKTLKIVAHRGLGQEFLNRFETMDASDATIQGSALRSGARVLIHDIITHPDHRQDRDIAA
ncbi:GAF domain-containing protein [Lichenifustis flavocetrariae]|uniref:GAF domain-containing protein n=1 Tax=Lichenifustis flavocetrariae TaxID=2949735 RepID=A0AA42CLC4_9HYPH|nr:GAF domain-containing protein [Lichenifustis flavocetrariae]MCW6511464.1 GAF domain-containing protein [Lichenifustis flavocetrariae]